MKARILVLALGMSLVSVLSASADPFLVTDPQDPNIVKSYDLTIDGKLVNVLPTIVENNAILKYDLKDVAVGKHDITIIAKGIWGQSMPVEYTFDKVLPTEVSGIMICPSGNITVSVGLNDAVIVKCND